MASHDLTSAKATILGATPGATPGIDGNPHERFPFAPAFSERFSSIGVVPVHQIFPYFSRDFRGSVGIENPCFLGGFLSEDFSLLVTFLLVTFSLLFRGFFVAWKKKQQQCSGVFRGFSVAFPWPSSWANFTRTRPGKVF